MEEKIPKPLQCNKCYGVGLIKKILNVKTVSAIISKFVINVKISEKMEIIKNVVNVPKKYKHII